MEWEKFVRESKEFPEIDLAATSGYSSVGK